jgi:hypothetical protein
MQPSSGGSSSLSRLMTLCALACLCASESLAIELLKAADWQLDAAADSFFMSGGASAASSVDSSKISALFDQYKGACARAHARQRQRPVLAVPVCASARAAAAAHALALSRSLLCARRAGRAFDTDQRH